MKVVVDVHASSTFWW